MRNTRPLLLPPVLLVWCLLAGVAHGGWFGYHESPDTPNIRYLAQFTPLEFMRDMKAPPNGTSNNATLPLVTAAAGRLSTATVETMPSLSQEGIAAQVVTLEACSEYAPHYHPRAAELLNVMDDPEGKGLMVGFIDENGGKKVVNVLRQGQVALTPEALVHWQANLGCGTVEYLVFLNNEDPGEVALAPALLSIPTAHIETAIHSDLDIIETLRRAQHNQTHGLVQGLADCRKKCQMATPRPPSDALQVLGYCPEGDPGIDGLRMWQSEVNKQGGVQASDGSQHRIDLTVTDSPPSNPSEYIAVISCKGSEEEIGQAMGGQKVVNIDCGEGRERRGRSRYSYSVVPPPSERLIQFMDKAASARLGKSVIMVIEKDGDAAAQEAASACSDTESLARFGASIQKLTITSAEASPPSEKLMSFLQDNRGDILVLCTGASAAEEIVDRVIATPFNYQAVVLTASDVDAERMAERFGNEADELFALAFWHPALRYKTTLFADPQSFADLHASLPTKSSQRPTHKTAACAAAGVALQQSLSALRSPSLLREGGEVLANELTTEVGDVRVETVFGPVNFQKSHSELELPVLQLSQGSLDPVLPAKYAVGQHVLPATTWATRGGCPPGTKQQDGTCTVCPRDTYSSSRDSRECTPCGEGTTSEEGSAACVDVAGGAMMGAVIGGVVGGVAVLVGLCLGGWFVWRRNKKGPKGTAKSHQQTAQQEIIDPEKYANGVSSTAMTATPININIPSQTSMGSGGTPRGVANIQIPSDLSGLSGGAGGGSNVPPLMPHPRSRENREAAGGGNQRLNINSLGSAGGYANTNSEARSDGSRGSMSINTESLQRDYNFTWIKPEDIDCQFDEDELIGQGGTCPVYLGSWHGNKVAIKRFPSKVVESGDMMKTFVTEVAAFETFRHPNIVNYFGCHPKRPYLIIMSYANGGSLYELLRDSRQKLSWRERIRLLLGISAGMTYLHGDSATKRPVCHGDMKSGNVLLHWEGMERIAKLTDFGFSTIKIASSTAQSVKGCTLRWAAPEIVDMSTGRTTETLKQADVFSFAVVMYEVLTRRLPYADLDDLAVIFFIQQGGRPTTPYFKDRHGNNHPRHPDAYSVPSECPQEVVQLMEECWHEQATKRPKFPEITRRLERIFKDIEAATPERRVTLSEAEAGGLINTSAHGHQPNSTASNDSKNDVSSEIQKRLAQQAMGDSVVSGVSDDSMGRDSYLGPGGLPPPGSSAVSSNSQGRERKGSIGKGRFETVHEHDEEE
ncbi:unnamed protein product [Vitrella brassicaformis CCMP3155]|uniref:Protein kinase domain-containing protein n=2 Tax=Vitrella brassicaformis TaxID=1169539 RepID=A0A0G4EY78_VITBC|nr:unnamed protein product [Vitrella brassicaformis CCMP3155]|eukprot:CEM03584.1 unnamed protein product [Vitrella brassicaformis CCMP3155]